MKTAAQFKIGPRLRTAAAIWLSLTPALISRATDPVPVATWPPELTGHTAAIIVTNNLAYIATAEGDLNVFDTSRVQHPRRLSTWSAPGSFFSGMAVSDKLAFLLRAKSDAGGFVENRLQIIDLSDPAHPQALGSYCNSFTSSRLDNGDNGADAPPPDAPPPGGYAWPAKGLNISGTRAYINWPDRVHIVDIADAANPRLVAEIRNGNADTVILGDQQYLATVNGFYDPFLFAGLAVVDLLNPTEARTLASVVDLSYAGGFRVDGGDHGGMNPPSVGSGFGTLRAGGNYLWWEGGTSFFGGWFDFSIEPGDHGAVVYIPPFYQRVSYLFDVSDPATPQLLTTNFNGNIQAGTLAGNRLYETSWQEGTNSLTGLRLTDISSPLTPVVAGRFAAPITGFWKLAALSEDDAFVFSSEGLTVLSLHNRLPVADASATPPIVISANNANATVVLDGSRSSDPDGDLLQYAWHEVGDNNVLAGGATTTATLPVGTHRIELVVDDGALAAENTITVQVITAAEAVNQLVSQLGAADLLDQNKQPLLATLNAATASFERGNFTAGRNQLAAFQNKVHAQIAHSKPALAAELSQAARTIIDAVK
jgi:hypothetical protein